VPFAVTVDFEYHTDACVTVCERARPSLPPSLPPLSTLYPCQRDSCQQIQLMSLSLPPSLPASPSLPPSLPPSLSLSLSIRFVSATRANRSAYRRTRLWGWSRLLFVTSAPRGTYRGAMRRFFFLSSNRMLARRKRSMRDRECDDEVEEVEFAILKRARRVLMRRSVTGRSFTRI
jgi:hypothetical protein